jgi:hypothetical protein
MKGKIRILMQKLSQVKKAKQLNEQLESLYTIIIGQYCALFIYRTEDVQEQLKFRYNLAKDLGVNDRTIMNYLQAYINWQQLPLLSLGMMPVSYFYNNKFNRIITYLQEHPNLQRLFSVTVQSTILCAQLQKLISKWINSMLQQYIYVQEGEN